MIFPVPVILKRAAAPRSVFCFGISVLLRLRFGVRFVLRSAARAVPHLRRGPATARCPPGEGSDRCANLRPSPARRTRALWCALAFLSPALPGRAMPGSLLGPAWQGMPLFGCCQLLGVGLHWRLYLIGFHRARCGIGRNSCHDVTFWRDLTRWHGLINWLALWPL
jgi:hypothetical protein